MSHALEAFKPLGSPPSTPASVKATLSSQTSTGKPSYKRRFDRKLLAKPSSKASVSSKPTSEPSPHLLTAAGDEPPTPTKPSQQPSLKYQAQLQDNEHAQTYSARAAAPAVHYPQSPSPLPIPQTQLSASMYYSQSYTPGNMTYYASATYQISPSSAAGAFYGGEARHRPPVGINPSPPVVNKPAYGSHTLAPSEPTIAEFPSQTAAAAPEIVPQGDESKHDTKQKARTGLMRFFHKKMR
ncbi:MAG: hypothetical protein L6R39_006639 [Caloplaca ligustica]|nr:MAG: hypothetical protein L6R39_006639 [Caloplaca ligustica]